MSSPMTQNYWDKSLDILNGKESVCFTVNSEVKVLLKVWYRRRSYRYGEYGNDKQNTGGSYWVRALGVP